MSSGIWIGIAVGVGLAIAALLQKRKSGKLEDRIVPLLRERGELTLGEVAEGVRMGSFMGRGKVALALNEMASGGRIEIIPAPEGTPQLEKVKRIKYRLTVAAPPAR